MRTLFLAWQAPNRSWFPVGRLDADVQGHDYRFAYTKGARQAESQVGFRPLPSFPEFDRKYESSDLFPLFQNRVLDPGRKDFATYLESLDLSPTTIDPIEILSVSGGERQTDNLEVFPRIEPRPDGVFLCRFFLHGWRHMPEIARERALSLRAGEELGISLELTNPSDPVAIQVTTRDYAFVGWTPRYLVSDLLKAISSKPRLSARVIRVNAADVPTNRRVLIELSGMLPQGFQPMSSEPFQLLH
jgi:hypothetical protein